mmetsp:Transcript_14807/g.19535  ORF Transcript_14807/g.19535 Transcript_14807/m.19535 type:complete len:82 (+) Transcript_14807:155-400(+)
MNITISSITAIEIGSKIKCKNSQSRRMGKKFHFILLEQNFNNLNAIFRVSTKTKTNKEQKLVHTSVRLITPKKEKKKNCLS